MNRQTDRVLFLPSHDTHTYTHIHTHVYTHIYIYLLIQWLDEMMKIVEKPSASAA